MHSYEWPLKDTVSRLSLSRFSQSRYSFAPGKLSVADFNDRFSVRFELRSMADIERFYANLGSVRSSPQAYRAAFLLEWKNSERLSDNRSTISAWRIY